MKKTLTFILGVIAAVALVSCQNGTGLKDPGVPAYEPARTITADFSGDVTLTAGANAKFVSADLELGTALVANRDSAQGWEQFTLEPRGDNVFAIKAQSSGKYVSADLDLGGALMANRDAAQGWELFKLHALGGDSYALQAQANGKYVCADLDNGARLAANRDSPQGWETFRIVPAGGSGEQVTVAYDTKDDWGNGYNGRLTLKNTGTREVSGWKVTFNAPEIAAIYNASMTQSGGLVTVTSKAGSAGEVLSPGETVSDIVFTVYSSSIKPTNVTLEESATEPPDAPANFVVSAGNGSVALDWDPSSGASGYAVYWAVGTTVTVETGTASDVGSATSWTHTGLANGTSYAYLVVARNSIGASGPTGVLSAVPEMLPPATPTGLAAVAGDEMVAITWNASAGASFYAVSATGLAEQTVASASLVLTGLTNGQEYSITVRAVNEAGSSAVSSPATATPFHNEAWSWYNPPVGGNLYGLITNGPVTAQKSAEWDSLYPAGIYGAKVTNNLWGIGFGNGAGSGTIFTESVNGSEVFGWAWNLTSYVPNQVISYQEIGWGWSPNASDFFRPDQPTPINKISSGKRYFVDFDLLRTDRSGAWNTAFDIWLYPQEKPVGGSAGFKGGYEIMVWFDHEVQGPWGSNPQDVWINGTHWKVYDNDGSAGWRVVTYINQDSPINTVRNYDVSNFIDDASSRYGAPTAYSVGLSREHYVNAIEFGNESCGGRGMMEIANYKIVID